MNARGPNNTVNGRIMCGVDRIKWVNGRIKNGVGRINCVNGRMMCGQGRKTALAETTETFFQ